MQFLACIAALVASVAAQAQIPNNQILNPGANSVIQAGGGVQSLTWTNPTSGNISVALYSGSNPVVTVAVLEDSAPNTGTYLWTPETWLPSGNDYTIGVSDLTGNAPTQYSPFFTIQLCSTCSSSTRSSTSSYSTQTVSVTGLDIGTRSDAAYPTLASAAATASGSQVSSGVAAAVTASSQASSGGASSAATPVAALASGGSSAAASSTAGAASALGASQNAILSQTGSAVAAATSAAASSVSKSTSGASSVKAVGYAGIAGLCAFFVALF